MPSHSIDKRALSDAWGRQAFRLLCEVRVYRGASNRAWYTESELAVLDVLEAKGHIEQTEVVRNGRPGRNYRMTTKGDDTLDQLAKLAHPSYLPPDANDGTDDGPDDEPKSVLEVF